MAKEITQIIEREKPDGDKEIIINVYDTETGKNEVVRLHTIMTETEIVVYKVLLMI